MQPHHAKEFRLIRAVAIWLNNGVCHNCKCVSLEPHAHHLDHNNKNNSLLNIAVLCHDCHKLFHRIPPQPHHAKKNIVVLLLRKICTYS